ncbi:Predicted branched-chain amino acid permease (azaleucine resistance) [Pseudooceanicola antarcticus]|uniref:Branched-chain amino acid transporter AzlC n=1 Tax=Pseudooceanicola antarcticus TaxID=1247613 RepID=A0A285IRX9_9RHOB|nr:AzlC family ABC transporter permease [Pseudooceanicola antarcticus]PJE31823.1 branched-chain amino acid transporter AzlC [Pseudooceanicola antarcticus]SNY50477.1 Predicted branched-chain amino acid permease (azaleucine resistance) [Pseudooceanicola antarcticus]
MTSYADPSAQASTRPVFFQGLRDGAPFLLVVSPFAMLFGVVATEAGLTVYEALVYSIAVIAGASQFASLQLLRDGAPVVVALVSALAVNLRMAMYSASLTPYLGDAPLWKRAVAAYFLVDQSYACSIVAFEKHREWSTAQRMAYFFGVILPICPMWYAMTVVGALVGSAIPPELALDFALPITFIAMVSPMLLTKAQMMAAGVAILLALVFAGLPYNLGLLIAALAGMMTGAALEKRLEDRS